MEDLLLSFTEKVIDDPNLLKQIKEKDANLKLEDLYKRASDRFWSIHENDTARIGPKLQQSRIEELKKHQKLIAKQFELGDADLANATDLDSLLQKAKAKYEADLRKKFEFKTDAEIQTRLSTQEVELQNLRHQLKHYTEVEVPLLKQANEKFIAEHKEQIWFNNYCNKFETTVSQMVLDNILPTIKKDIYAQYDVKADPTDGKYYLFDKTNGTKVQDGMFDFLTIDKVLVQKLREFGILKESNGTPGNPAPDLPGKKTPPTDATPIDSPYNDGLKRALENYQRIAEKTKR